MLRRLSLLLALACAACVPDPGPDADASAADAGAADAGAVDTDGEEDAGDVPRDPADAGRPPPASDDAGAPDAGPQGPVVTDAGPTEDAGGAPGPLAHDLTLVVDRDVDPAPTPINQAYVAAIDATQAGDRILSFQKYFKSAPVIGSLIDAARRGVDVLGLYRDEVEPTCESLLAPDDVVDCDALFVEASETHHKNIMIERADGTVWGLVGSYNPRVRNTSSPRTHTALTFEVDDGAPLFAFYAAEAQRLQGTGDDPTSPLTVPVEGGGSLTFTMHPGPDSPAEALLDELDGCDDTLWVSYYGALADSVGAPVFDRLAELHDDGCDVRVLLDESAGLARLSLLARGVPVQHPTFPAGGGTLGHKIVSVVRDGETRLLQGSANLDLIQHTVNHNLTVAVRVPGTELADVIDAELGRYWVD